MSGNYGQNNRTLNVDTLFVRDIYFRDFANNPIPANQPFVSRGDGGTYFTSSFASTIALPAINAITASTVTGPYQFAPIGVFNTFSLNPGAGMEFYSNAQDGGLIIYNIGPEQIIADGQVLPFTNLPDYTVGGRTLQYIGTGDTYLQVSDATIFFNSVYNSSISTVLFLQSTTIGLEYQLNSSISILNSLITSTGLYNYNLISSYFLTPNVINISTVSTSLLVLGDNYIEDTPLRDSVYDPCVVYTGSTILSTNTDFLTFNDNFSGVTFAIDKEYLYGSSTLLYGPSTTTVTRGQQVQLGWFPTLSTQTNTQSLRAQFVPVVQQIQVLEQLVSTSGFSSITNYYMKNIGRFDEICNPNKISLISPVIAATLRKDNTVNNSWIQYDTATSSIVWGNNGGSGTLPSGSNYGDYLYWNGTAWEVGLSTISIGDQAGGGFVTAEGQGEAAIAIGAAAGYSTQGAYAVAMGYTAGQYAQMETAVAIGNAAGNSNQGSNTVAIGNYAGGTEQGDLGIAIGNYAGYSNQKRAGVAIGYYAGQFEQGSNAVAMGIYAGNSNQGIESVAIGTSAGFNNQSSFGIAIGYYAASNTQGFNAIAIGSNAGRIYQGDYAVAVGALAGYANQSTCTIVINATGAALDTVQASSFYVAPIRYDSTVTTSFLQYNTTTKEVVWNTGTSTMTQSLIPDIDNLYDIGTSTLRLRHLYVGPSSLTIGTGSISADNGGNLFTTNALGTTVSVGSGALATTNFCVATGDGPNYLAYSYDGTNWNGLGTEPFLAGGHGLCAAWNGSLWLAGGQDNLGNGNTIAYSSDGIHWALANSPFLNECFCIAWNGSMWVAGGADNATVAYSYDGINWTSLGLSVFNIVCNAVAWNGTMWVAAGVNTSGSDMPIFYSYNGINWTPGNQLAPPPNNGPTNFIFNLAKCVAWNGEIWVVGGVATYASDEYVIAYSYDGINWQVSPSVNIFSSRCTCIAWNGSLWVAGGDGDAFETLAYSIDGINWTQATTQIFQNTCYSVTWNGSVWIAGGQDDTNTLAYSYDGMNWVGLGETIFEGGDGCLGLASRNVLPYVGSSPIPFTRMSTIAYGAGAGGIRQGINAVAIGNSAGLSTQTSNAIAIGFNAGQYTQGSVGIAIGHLAGRSNQQANTIAIGASAGLSAQTTNAVAIGFSAGQLSQGNVGIAIGNLAGQNSQTSASIAIGNVAAQNNQGSLCVAIGNGAGQSNQQANAIAIGNLAGRFTQGTRSIAIGSSAALSNQGDYSVVIGPETDDVRGDQTVVIGYNAGAASGGSVSIGVGAGQSNQSPNSVAIGNSAGGLFQGLFGTAIGWQAGYSTQGAYGVAIGYRAGGAGQREDAVAVGGFAGEKNQGSNAVAIGYAAGSNNQSTNTIIINATGLALNAQVPNSLYIAPIRQNNTITSNVLVYNTVTSEVAYNTTKTFVINHPKDESKYLVHACLEGPEAGVYYRGTGTIADLESSVVVELPDYVDALATDLTVQVTPIYNGAVRVLNASCVSNNKFAVYGDSGDFHWHVYGRRAAVVVEPKKSDVSVLGTGPYRWIA